MLTKKEFNGLQIHIENPAGTTRLGHNWHTRMHYHYGFIEGTKGVDGDAIDVLLPPYNEFQSEKIYVMHQNKRGTEEYDEDKVLLGFENEEDAETSWAKGYDDAALYRGKITPWTIEELKEVLKNSKGEPGKLDVSAKRKWLKRDKTAQLRIGLSLLPYFKGRKYRQ